MRSTVSGALLALLLASGCSAGGEDRPTHEKPSETPFRALDEAGVTACTEFARWLADGRDPATRADVTRNIRITASNSNSGELSVKAATLFRADQGDGSWPIAADSFAYECERLGWSADDAQ